MGSVDAKTATEAIDGADPATGNPAECDSTNDQRDRTGNGLPAGRSAGRFHRRRHAKARFGILSTIHPSDRHEVRVLPRHQHANQ